MTGSEKKKSRVLSIGDAFVDLLSTVRAFPPSGGCAWGNAITTAAGGASGNVAANLAQLELDSAFLGLVGKDSYGSYLLNDFEHSGVDTQYITSCPGEFTGVVFTIVDMAGERTFFPCALGAAHSKLSVDIADRMDYSQFDMVFACGVCLVEMPAREAVIHALKIARQNNVPTYYDPNLRLDADIFTAEYRKAQWEAMRYATVVLVGDYELTQLTQSSDWVAGAERLLDNGAESVIVKRGAEGAAAVFPDRQPIMVPAFSVDAVDTTGAGDAFDAGFMAAIAYGLGVEAALEYANATAALVVNRVGARLTSLRREVEALVRERGKNLP